MTKREIINKLHKEGNFFLNDPDFKRCWDLDATHAREFLENKGFNVIDNREDYNCGIATFICGGKTYTLSTNGYMCQKFRKEIY